MSGRFKKAHIIFELFEIAVAVRVAKLHLEGALK